MPEGQLASLVKDHRVDSVVLAYSDLHHEEVMHRASITLSAGATFELLGPRDTMLKAGVPVIAVTATRTGAGKSTVSRHICRILRRTGKKFNIVRHPMPYGRLERQVVQKFQTHEDLDKYECTIEEREEYEPHIEEGNTVYAGVDYASILVEASRNTDCLVWDGGNNDMPFFAPDLHITIADALRPGHEVTYHPGETNLRMADAVVINKVSDENAESVRVIVQNIASVNPKASIVRASSDLKVMQPSLIKGKRVLVVEDGPTVTHGGMSASIGLLAARKYGASVIIDPRPLALGSIKDTYETYKHLGPVLPAMGYGQEQMRELQEVISRAHADTVVLGTPIDLGKVITIERPYVRVRYEIAEIGRPTIEDLIHSSKIFS